MKLFNLNRSATLWIIMLVCFSYCKKEKTEEQSVEQGIALSKQGHSATLGNQVISIPEPCIQRCLVAGQNMNIGTVDVALADNGDLLITYNITKPQIYLLEVHADVFKTVEQLKQDKKLSSGGAVPGKFAFKDSFPLKSNVSKYTVVVPKAYVDKNSNNGCMFIATHAALSTGETAWGGICADTPKGTSLENARPFPGSNWSVYFDFCAEQCQAMDFTFAWEDLHNQPNDGDYNDLVVQANSIRFADQLKLTFKVVARGAFNDHTLNVRIPKAGITSIEGYNGAPAPSYTSDGSDYIIQIFESTKNALVPNGASYFQSNTYNEFDCVPFAVKNIVLKVDNSFNYNTSKPYSPFIRVYPSGAAPFGGFYDLSIFQFTGDSESTWQSAQGTTYPNGIIIPNNWRWPLEGVEITGPYPSFPNYNWASNLANFSLTYDQNKCN